MSRRSRNARIWAVVVLGWVLSDFWCLPALAQTPGSRPAAAARALQEDLSALAIRIRSLPDSAEPAPADLAAIRAAVDRVRASHFLVAADHQSRASRLGERGVPATILQRQQAAEQSYRDRIARVLEAAAALDHPDAAPAAIRTALDALAREFGPIDDESDRRPIGAALAHRTLLLPQQGPAFAASITPAYLTAAPASPSEADRRGVDTAAHARAIAAKAAELGRDPIAVFEFVQNQIRTDFYYGSMKGAFGTLSEGSGNDADQAALLVALLRASGIAARYVRGVIALPGEQAAAWTGVNSARRAAEVFTRAGIPFRPIRQGATIGSFEVEHTWVETYVPYANYRGVRLGEHGEAWIPLDASMKRFQIAAGEDLVDAIGFRASALLPLYLGDPEVTSALDFFRARVSSYLDAEREDLSFDQAMSTHTISAVKAGLLPSTLPYAVVSINEESAELPERLLHRVRFAAEGEGGVSFDIVIPAAALAGRRLTLSYIPATVEDQAAVHAFMGMDNTPAYLVKLRPVLKAGGVVQAAGATPVQMGSMHRLTIEIQAPRRTVPIVNDVIAGGYYAIGLGADAAPYEIAPAPAQEDTEGRAADLLFAAAIDYTKRWNDAERLLERLLRVRNVRATLSEVMVGGQFTRTLLFGQPQAIEWRGVFVDADLRPSDAIVVGADDSRASDFMRLSGLAGSALEGEVLHAAFGADAVSAVRLLQLARQQGLAVHEIDAANAAAVIPTLDTSPLVRADIADAVTLGFRVTVPQRDLTRHAWTGIGFLIVDPDTGSGAYMISGRFAGGSTTEDPENWSDTDLADALREPYAPESNDDPTSAVTIRRIFVTDRQSGDVGTVLPRELAVWVGDAEGRPVRNAQVTFEALDGQGSFGGQPTVALVTNHSGVARAPFTLGTTTAISPFYLFERPGDEYPTQVGQNFVTARVQGAGGTIPLDVPFQLFAHPAAAHHLTRVLGDGNMGLVGTAAGTLMVRVADRYENPLSNVNVAFAVQPFDPQTTPAGAVNVSLYPLDPACAVPVPLIGDCGATAAASDSSTIFGAAMNTILGNIVETGYRVAASVPGLDPVTFTLRSHAGPDVLGRQGTQLIMTLLQRVTDQSSITDAARVGVVYGRPLDAELVVVEPDFVVEPTGVTPCGESPACYRVRQLGTHRTRTVDVHRAGDPIVYVGAHGPVQGAKQLETGRVTFQPVSGGGATTPPVADSQPDNPSPGAYRTRITLGQLPAANDIRITATAAVWAPRLEPASGAIAVGLVDLEAGEFVRGFDAPGQPLIGGAELPLTYRVFGVQASISSPQRIVIGPSGGAIADYEIDYLIEPAEYEAQLAQVDLLVAGGPPEWVALFPGSAVSGAGTIDIRQGVAFDPAERYLLRVLLNRGGEGEIPGNPANFEPYLAGPLGVDFRSRRNLAENSRRLQTIDLAGRLREEHAQLTGIIRRGLDQAPARCRVAILNLGLSMIEQGSGACLWSNGFDTDPVAACAAFQPGVSDHDFELFVPDVARDDGNCIAEQLNQAAADSDLGDITFFPMSKEQFQRGELNITPPGDAGGADAVGDLGLGRQTLLLKWVLEGEYVTGFPELFTPDTSGPEDTPRYTRPLQLILDDLRDTAWDGEATGIPALEGYEIAIRERFNFYKSRAHIRMTGDQARHPKTFLFEEMQKDIRNAAKAAIRAAAARLVIHPEANRLLFVSRREYRESGCVTGVPNPSAPGAPAQWFGKRCDSFEELITSTAARTLTQNLNVFTPAEVEHQVFEFFRLKAEPVCAAAECTTRLMQEAAANDFLTLAIAFIRNAVDRTLPEWTPDSDPDPTQRQQRRDNILNAMLAQPARELSATHDFELRVFNDNQVELEQVPLTAYGDGPPALPNHVIARIQPRSETIIDVLRDGTGEPIPDDDGDPRPIFPIALPAEDYHVTWMLDPDSQIRECNKHDNYTGFYSYRLNENTGAVPVFPPVQAPVPLPDPPPECAAHVIPSLRLTKLVNGQPDIKVAPNVPVVISHRFVNTSAVRLENIEIDDPLVGAIYGPFALNPGQSMEILDEYRPTQLGVEIIAPSEAVGFVAGGGIARAWDAVFITVVGSPCPAMLQTITPDPNRYHAEDADPIEGVSAGDPISTVARGGRAYRYYRVVRGTGAPLADAQLQLSRDGALLPGAHATDGTGMVMHAPVDDSDDGRGLELLADAIGSPAASPYSIRFALANGGAVCADPFFVQVREREFTRTWTAGGALKVSGSVGIGLAGESGGGITVAVTERADDNQTRSKLGITTRSRAKLSAKVGLASPGFTVAVAGARAELGASVDAKAGAAISTSDSYEFLYPENSNELPFEEKARIGGLLLATVNSAGSRSLPVVGRLTSWITNWVIDLASDYESRKKSEKYAAGLDMSVSGAATGTLGLAAFRRGGNERLGKMSFGLQGGGALDLSVGAEGSVAFKYGVVPGQGRQLREVVPGYQINAGVNLGLELGLDLGDDISGFAENLKRGLDGALTGAWGAELAFDAASLNPKKLDITYRSRKDWGWQVAGNGYVEGSVNADDDLRTVTYTVTDRAAIQSAINTSAVVAGAAAVGLPLSLPVGGAPLLGAGLLITETVMLFNLLDTYSATYQVVAETGDSIAVPFELGAAFGASLKGSIDLKFDRAMSRMIESGIVLQGEEYAYERYSPTEIVPELPADLSDTQQTIQAAIDAAVETGSGGVTVASVSPEPGPNVLTTATQATLAFDGAAVTAPEVQALSFEYDGAPGPVAPVLQLPEDTAGPADVPHYGVGGFHQFAPQNAVMSAPGTLTLRYTDAQVPGGDEGTLAIYLWSDEQNDWIRIGGVVDTVNNTITAAITRLGLYTAAPPMPAGTFTFSSQWSTSAGADPITTVTYTSGFIRMNTGFTVPDGTLLTVRTVAGEGDLVPFGIITTADADPLTEGIQVAAENGVIRFAAQYPGAAGAPRLFVNAVRGTALADIVVPFQ